RASFVCRVFEEGGNFSIDRFSLPYSPYKSYVGIKLPEGDRYSGQLMTDTNNIVQIATVDENGKPISRDKLIVKVYKVKWRWWWDNYDENLGDYVGDEYHEPYETKEISSVSGKAQFILRVNRPDWGRFLVRVTDKESGHSTGQTVYLDWPYWAGKSNKEDNKGATVLAFNSDKEKYNVGDEIKLSIPSSEGGRALISLETGSKVLNAFWAETKKGSTEVKIPVTPEMAPNIYANVTLVQPHAQTTNDMPIRMYGVIPIQIEDPNTHLRPVIQTAEVFRPEEKASISVSEENGKPMTYTLAVVDEGLLDLTRFETPDPWKYFFAREALGVKTWDLFDNVIGAWGATLQKLLAIGGDGEGKGKEGAKANRFKPMVKFFGPFALEKGKKAKHEFMMPQYVGSVRIMVIAGNHSSKHSEEVYAYGSAEKTVAVKKPLMILATLPRVVGPNEIVNLPVTVFAMEKNVKNVNVEVQTNEFFSPLEGLKKNIFFKEVGDEVINFPFKVNPKLGIGKVKVMAMCGGEKATYDIEIDVRNPNPKITDVVETVIEPGKTWASDYKPVGMAGTNNAVLEISNIPPVNLEYRLKYLIQYPYGCVEQTTSSAFPQLYLSDIMELNSNFQAAIDKNIKAAVKRLQNFQTSSGGFSYWPGYYDADEWGSSYAGHFLLEAEAKGYTLPAGVIDSWKKYQKKVANAWTYHPKGYRYWYYNDDLEQAYRLYTLALAKSPELGAMNRLRESNELSYNAKWRLAAAYALAGQPEVAKQLVMNAPVAVSKYSEMCYTYGSSERDEAMIVEALCIMGNYVKAAPVVKELSQELSDNRFWMSTQTTAYSLIAVSRFAKSGGSSNSMSYAWAINGAAPQNKNTKLPMSQIPIEVKG
ncbi:MAG TPA: alpha-2-macroglobulin family protein, partial [Bacteroidia bacterium]